MKVIYKSDVTKPISEVKHGQCFMKEGVIFMKACRDFDYAVSLEDGIIYKLVDMDEQVISVEAEVVVE